MIELTGVDPYVYVYETWKLSVLLDNISHVKQFTGRESNKCGAEVHLNNGKIIYVTEKVDEVSRRIRDYAETAQKERIAAMVAEEVAKQLSVRETHG